MSGPSDGFDALAKAIKRGDLLAVRALLESEQAPDVRNKHQWTALMLAASAGRTPIVECLLAYGADVNATNDSGVSPLGYAALHGECRVIEVLLNAGASVNVRPHGISLLEFASSGNGAARTRRHLQLMAEAGAC